MEWRTDLENAPKDETEILTWTGQDNYIICVWWHDQGWVDAQEYLPRNPSHWMPLPPAPATGDD